MAFEGWCMLHSIKQCMWSLDALCQSLLIFTFDAFFVRDRYVTWPSLSLFCLWHFLEEYLWFVGYRSMRRISLDGLAWSWILQHRLFAPFDWLIRSIGSTCSYSPSLWLWNADRILVFVDRGDSYLVCNGRGILCFSYVFCFRKLVIDVFGIFIIREVDFELYLWLYVVDALDLWHLVHF